MLISKSTRRQLLWSRESTFRAAVLGLAAIVVGLVPGQVQALEEGEQRVDQAYGYVCRMPDREIDLQVRVTAVLPLRIRASERIRPSEVGVAVTLNRSALVGVDETRDGSESPEPDSVASDDGATALAGQVELTVPVSQGGRAVEALWVLGVDQAPLPESGDVDVVATGPVPWVKAQSNGDVTLAVGKLRLTVAAVRKDGTATDAEPLVGDCAPAAGQSTVLAHVSVPLSAEGGVKAPQVAPPAAASEQSGPRTLAERRWPKGIPDPINAKCTYLAFPDRESQPAHGYLAGFSNVSKLGGAIEFDDPAHFNLNLAKRADVALGAGCPVSGLIIFSDAELDYKGKPQLPPVKSTFLTYGFMPTTATVELAAVGRTEIVSMALPIRPTGSPELTYLYSELSIRIRDVKVNGVKLDVGQNCRSERPMNLLLKGEGVTLDGAVTGYSVVPGGPLTGTSYIPPFHGCGSSEDLDNVFTAALSGPDNFSKMIQAPICTWLEGTQNHHLCPDPPKPSPQR